LGSCFSFSHIEACLNTHFLAKTRDIKPISPNEIKIMSNLKAPQAPSRLFAFIQYSVIFAMLWCVLPLVSAALGIGILKATGLVTRLAIGPILFCGFFVFVTRFIFKHKFGLSFWYLLFILSWGALGAVFGALFGAIFGLSWGEEFIYILSDPKDMVVAKGVGLITGVSYCVALGSITGTSLASQRRRNDVKPSGFFGNLIAFSASDTVGRVISTVIQVPLCILLAAIFLFVSRIASGNAAIAIGVVLGALMGCLQGWLTDWISGRMVTGSPSPLASSIPLPAASVLINPNRKVAWGRSCQSLTQLC
jgi:hypothetical protein